MRKSVALLVVLATIVMTVTISAASDEPAEADWDPQEITDKVHYQVDPENMTARIIGCGLQSLYPNMFEEIPETVTFEGEEYTVTTLGPGAVPREIRGVSIPDTVTTIERGAIVNTLISYLTIPSSVDTIEPGALSNNRYLRTISLESTEHFHLHEGVLYTNDGTLLCYPADLRDRTRYQVEDGTVAIGAYAFAGCSILQNLILSPTVESIGDGAFVLCKSFREITYAGMDIYGYQVTLPESVREIGNEAFYDLPITSVYLPDGITEIGYETFNGCSELERVSLPSNLQRIGISAFMDCEALTEITIPESVTKIESYAFSNTSIESVELPSGLTFLGSYVFAGCEDLAEANIPSGIQAVPNSTFSGCVSLTSVELPRDLGTVGDSAFNGCASLTDVEIPDSVTLIGSFAFYGCAGLESLDIPDGINRLGYGAFSQCTGLREVFVPLNIMGNADESFHGITFLDKYGDVISDLYKMEGYVFRSHDDTPVLHMEDDLSGESFVVSLDLGGGMIASAPGWDETDGGLSRSFPAYTAVSDIVADLPDPLREHYVFESWDYAPGNLTSDVTIVAEWKLAEYRVTIDLDGGTAYPDSSWRHSGDRYYRNFEAFTTIDAVISSFAVASKENHYFAGWDRGGHTSVTEDLTITATWEVSMCDVTLDLDGGRASLGQGWTLMDGTYRNGFPAGTSYDEMLEGVGTPTKTDHMFVGWKYESDGPLSVTITAVWEESDGTVVLHIDLNGGRASPDDTWTAEEGGYWKALDPDYRIWDILEDIGAERDGYELYSVSTEVGPDGGLYATVEWISLEPFVVTMDLDGGTAQPGPPWTGSGDTFVAEFEDFTRISKILDSFPEPTRLGYKFTGWDYPEFVLREDMTIRATWYEVGCQVIVSLNGGEADPDSSWTRNADGTYERFFPHGVSASEVVSEFGEPERFGYTLSGWEPSVSSEGDSMIISAVWTLNPETVAPREDGGTVTTVTESVTGGAKVTITVRDAAGNTVSVSVHEVKTVGGMRFDIESFEYSSGPVSRGMSVFIESGHGTTSMEVQETRDGACTARMVAESADGDYAGILSDVAAAIAEAGVSPTDGVLMDQDGDGLEIDLSETELDGLAEYNMGIEVHDDEDMISLDAGTIEDLSADHGSLHVEVGCSDTGALPSGLDGLVGSQYISVSITADGAADVLMPGSVIIVMDVPDGVPGDAVLRVVSDGDWSDSPVEFSRDGDGMILVTSVGGSFAFASGDMDDVQEPGDDTTIYIIAAIAAIAVIACIAVVLRHR